MIGPALAQAGVTAQSGQATALRLGSPKDLRFAAKVKAGIAKLGTGPDARVELMLRDKTKLRGYISEASEERFSVVDDKTGATTAILYPQVKSAKGNNLATGEAIGIGLVFGIITALVILYSRK